MRYRTAAVALFLVVLLALPARAADAAPSETVEKFHSALLSAMQADGATSKRRFDLIAPVMDQTFDFTVMIRTATGRHWRAASKDDQAGLLDAFRRASIASYASQFSSYSGERFVTGETRDGPSGTRIVSTELVTTGKSVTLAYVLRLKDGAWRIIDILLDKGISQLAVRTAEYGRTLKDGGVALLTRTLADQAARLKGS